MIVFTKGKDVKYVDEKSKLIAILKEDGWNCEQYGPEKEKPNKRGRPAKNTTKED